MIRKREQRPPPVGVRVEKRERLVPIGVDIVGYRRITLRGGKAISRGDVRGFDHGAFF
jgi:hypothetical protein